MQRSDSAGWAKPGIDAADAFLSQRAVVGRQDVASKGWDLLKQLVLGQVQQRLLWLWLWL
jgi:hypothetical protein